MMGFYNEKEQLYLDVFCISLGASLLQVRVEMQFSRNVVPDNVALWLIHLQAKA